jgi:hypothetical protein
LESKRRSTAANAVRGWIRTWPCEAFSTNPGWGRSNSATRISSTERHGPYRASHIAGYVMPGCGFAWRSGQMGVDKQPTVREPGALSGLNYSHHPQVPDDVLPAAACAICSFAQGCAGVGLAPSSLCSGAPAGSALILRAYNSIVGLAVSPWAKMLSSTVIITASRMVDSPG